MVKISVKRQDVCKSKHNKMAMDLLFDAANKAPSAHHLCKTTVGTCFVFWQQVGRRSPYQNKTVPCKVKLLIKARESWWFHTVSFELQTVTSRNSPFYVGNSVYGFGGFVGK